MEDRLYKIKMFLYDTPTLDEIVFYQNDTNSCTFLFDFYTNSSSKYNLTNSELVIIIERNDNTQITDKLTFIDGAYKYKLPNNAINVIGTHKVTIQSFGATNNRLTFGSFKYKIKSDTKVKDISTDVNFPILTNLIGEVNTLKVNVENLVVPRGEQGIQGIQAQGIQGLKGDTGLKGDKGDQGIQGIQGIKGDNGQQGAKGDTGSQGIQGIQGEKGADGVGGTGSVRSVNNTMPDGNGNITIQGNQIPCWDSYGANKGNIHNYIEYLCEEVDILYNQINNADNLISSINLTLENKASKNPTVEWIYPTLLNGWKNTTYDEHASYYKDDLGIVHLRGIVLGGVANPWTNIFTLPIECRPTGTQGFTITSNLEFGVAYVTSAGQVQFAKGTNTEFSLNGISYKAVV